LGRSRFRCVNYGVFKIARLQPFSEYRAIQRDIREQPIVADVVKAAFNVSL